MHIQEINMRNSAIKHKGKDDMFHVTKNTTVSQVNESENEK